MKELSVTIEVSEEYLRSYHKAFFTKIVSGKKSLPIFAEELHHICLDWGSFI